MITIYKWIYIVSIVLAIVLIVAAIILFFSLHICAVIKELKNSHEQEDIKVLLKNSVLLNPQIQDDLPNIEGYNDLLASYFRILKQQEKQIEEMQRNARIARGEIIEETKIIIPTYDMELNAPQGLGDEKKYNVELAGTDVLAKLEIRIDNCKVARG
ncbi:MAG: hypothetical protein Q4F05_02855 [bacterium]|nr:hypothetical protein [bacterium]